MNLKSALARTWGAAAVVLSLGVGSALGALPAARDTSFTTLPMNGLPNSSVLLPNGKIIIGGNFQTIGGESRPALARLNADGTLDNTFVPPLAGQGIWGKPTVYDVVVAADGKIIAAGTPAFQTTGAVLRTNIIRFNADGSVDASWNAGEIQPFKGLAVQPDGKVIYSTFLLDRGLFGPARLNANGTPDTSFNYVRGIVSGLGCIQFHVQDSGMILGLAGDNDPNRIGNQQLFRLDATGMEDFNFKFPLPPNTVVDDSRFAVAADGRILVAPYDGFVPAITRLAADGTRDPNFTYRGQPNGQGLYPVPAAFLPDGGAVLVRQPTAGDRRLSFFYLSAEGKLLASRDLPNSASDNGVVGIGTLQARAFAMQPDGKLLFAAAFLDGFQNTFGMFRLPPPPTPAPPVITVQPETKSIGAGESLFLSVTTTSDTPMTYQWQRFGTNLAGQTFQNLNLGQNSLDRAGEFRAIVANSFASVTSQVATITVRPPAAMVMTVQPQGGAVKLSQSYFLNAQCSTEVQTGHQWYKDGQLLPNGASQGFGSAGLNLVANDTTRAGDYFVVFTNDFGGSVTSAVAHIDLILPGPPQITVQPQDLTLFSGQPVQLAVTAIADGFMTYQWQHAGTNLVRNASVPNVTNPTLFVAGTDTNRGGEYSLIVTVSPGGSTTSRVAQVTLLPSGPPVIFRPPVSLTADFGQSTNLSAGFNGEAPITVYWLHAGTNVLQSFGRPGQTYPSLDAPATNIFALPVLDSTAGDYQFVASNRWGAVTSAVATVTARPLPPATVTRDLADVTVGIGEFNTVGLRSGLVVTNCCGQTETTHVLELNPGSVIPPFTANGPWHLAVGASNRFYVGAQNGVVGASGTWGFSPGSVGFTGLELTNFPTAGIVSHMELFDDGRYGVIPLSGAAGSGSESGTFRVLGARRPATNVLSFDLVSSNSVQVVWLKDGQPLSLNTGRITTLNESFGVPPAPTGVSQRVRLTVSDVVAADAGRYLAVITNLVRNPDTSFGQPPYLVTSVTTTREAVVTLKGYAEDFAPVVTSAVEFGTPTGMDDADSVALTPDGATLLAWHSFTFGGNGGESRRLGRYDRDGRQEWLFGDYPAVIRSVISDGADGAIVGGQDTATRNWFIRRQRPVPVVNAGKTNLVMTNLWQVSAEAPSTNAVPINVAKNAEIVRLLPATDGFVVAGRFRGNVRFGATNVWVLFNNVYSPIGGETLTNASPGGALWDLFVAKYDLDGRFLWVRGYGGTNDEVLTSFTSDRAGNLYLGGSFKAQANFGAVPLAATKVVQSATVTQYGQDGFVAKLDAQGTPLWAKNFGGTNNLFIAETAVTAVAADTNGVFFTATRSSLTAMLQPGLPATPRYLARLSSVGELLWTQELSAQDRGLLEVDGQGNAVVVDAARFGAQQSGVTYGAGSVFPGAFAGGVLAKFNPAGTLLWLRGLDEKLPYTDDPRSANPQRMALRADGEVVLAGNLPGGTSSSSSRSAGQRFDGFEFPTTTNATANPTEVFLLRLAPQFVLAAPEFVQEPVSQTGLLQDRLVLEGAASGAPTPAYQWLFNGVPLPGATSRILIIPELFRTNRGTYALVASNAYGVTTSPPITVTPQLRPNMTGWTMVTSATNYLGTPQRVAVDDAGNAYLVHNELARGAALWLEKFNPDGHWAWRYQGPQTIHATHGPLVAPTGEVFLVGNFVARLNPDDGSTLWTKPNLGGNSALVAADLDGTGHVRLVFADRSVRRFDFAGNELPVITLTTLPFTVQPVNSRHSFDRNGGFYFYANRVEALNLGPTNFPALGNNGAQTWVLARYDATGAFQWVQSFSGPGIGSVYPFRVMTDAAGNALVAGSFGIGNQPNLVFTIGTNQLKGFGYAAKVNPAGEVQWAKSWYLNVDDAVLSPDGGIVMAGWFRSAPLANGSYTRQIPFGTNVVAGSSVTGHDAFLAKVAADGQESWIRHTGSPDFKTFDNAKDYCVAVNGSGSVWTGGFALFQPESAALDFGDLRYEWPDLRAYNFANLFGDLSTSYLARLEPGAPTEAAEITFELPAPGSTTLRLSWPPGYRLQHRATLYSGDWETLNVTPPYEATINAGQGYFRVVP